MRLKVIPLDVTSGLTSAKTSVMNTVKPAVNTVVVPILSVIIVGFLLFFISGAVSHHRGGEEYSDKIIKIMVCLVALILVLSFPTWGWTMVGV